MRIYTSRAVASAGKMLFCNEGRVAKKKTKTKKKQNL